VGKDVENLGESVQVAGGDVVQPSTTVSPEPEVQQTSLKADDQQETFEERIARLESSYRSLQGDKDRGTNKALRGVEDLNERFAEYEKYAKLRTDGKNKDEAQRAMVLDDIVQERMGTQVAQEPVGSQAVVPSWAEADVFLREQGIDPNDAKVLEMVREGNSRPEDYFALALERKTSPVTEPNAAQKMPTGTGGVMGAPNVEELTARLKELQKQPLQHLEERKTIMEELAKLTPRE
jgi:hypothetical protein